MFCPLASGSKGNALFVRTDTTRILIDVGLSVRALTQRLQEIDVQLDTIDAVMITHEHTDHMAGLNTLLKRYPMPVLANAATAKALCRLIEVRPRFKIFTTESFTFGDIDVTPFPISHDAIDPVGFALRTPQMRLGICTDLGIVGSHIIQQLAGADILYVESNHCPNLVHASNRPAVYKQRVLSRQGHLSNAQCATLLQALVHPNLRHVILAHLSSECNRPELALATARAVLPPHVTLSIAQQDVITTVPIPSSAVPCGA